MPPVPVTTGVLDEHQILVFLVQAGLLIGGARLLGAIFRRANQPSVIGEILAGVVLGPSLLGTVSPDWHEWIFGDPEVETVIFSIAWLGVILLVVVIGFETDLEIISRYRRAALAVSAGAMLAPLLATGILAGLTPASFRGPIADDLTYAGFLGIALSVAAIPVVAKILRELGFIRRDFGQLTLAAGMTIDAVGWVLLGALTGIATGGFRLTSTLTTIGGLVVFVVVAGTVGVWLLDRLFRRVVARESAAAGVSITVVAALIGGAITARLHLEAILGAFVIGFAAGRARHRPPRLLSTLEAMTGAVFGPIFFAYSGLRMDIGAFADVATILWTAALTLVAVITKIVGTTFAARRVGLSATDGISLGVGLSALGAMGIVAALLGLNVGVLSETGYSVLVTAAIITSLGAPILLRFVANSGDIRPAELERLRAEEVAARAQILGARRILIPTRGGLSTRYAAALARSVFPKAELTLLTVDTNDGTWWQRLRQPSEPLGNLVGLAKEIDGAHLIRRKARDPARAIADEAAFGYDLVWLGVTESPDAAGFSPVLERVIALVETITVLVRFPPGDFIPQSLPRRLLVPVTATRGTRAAEELAYTVAGRDRGQVTALHVVSRPDSYGAVGDEQALNDALEAGRATLAAAAEFGEQLGVTVKTLIEVDSNEAESMLTYANSGQFDLLVLGAQSRALAERSFFGHTASYLLQRSHIPVVVIGIPAGLGRSINESATDRPG